MAAPGMPGGRCHQLTLVSSRWRSLTRKDKEASIVLCSNCTGSRHSQVMVVLWLPSVNQLWKCLIVQRERQRETDRQTHRQTDRQSVCVCGEGGGRERERERDRQTDRQTDRQKGINRERERESVA